MEKVNILHYDVRLFDAEDFRDEMVRFCREGQLQSILFLSVSILEEAMVCPEYRERLSGFQLLLPGQENVLSMHSLEEYQQQQLMMDDRYLTQLLSYLEESGRTLYLVGDQYEKVQVFMQYCQECYKELRIVGNFVGGEKMEDDSLLNDINVTCPDVILTAIAPQLQEHWILDNVDKLNGRVCIGADVLVLGALKRFRKQVEKEDHSRIYNWLVELRDTVIDHTQKRKFRLDYEHYMKQQKVLEKRS